MIGLLLGLFAATCPAGVHTAARPTAPCVTADGQLHTPRIDFRPNSAKLTPAARRVIIEIARWLKAHDIRLVEVQGHLDAPERYGIKLSDQRAAAVRAALIEQGLPPEAVVSKGFGEDRPLFTKRVPAQNRLNRRVELWLVTWGTQDHPALRADCARPCATAGRCRSHRRQCVAGPPPPPK